MMADLGAVSQSEFSIFSSRPQPVWRDYNTPAKLLAIDVSDSIVVTAKLDTVVYPDAVVYLYYRRNGALIDKQKTNASGQVTFTNLDVNDTGAYFAVADLPGEGENMIIYAYL